MRIALLKYGSGMPFYRLEKLEQVLGIPLPASTQWEIVEDEAEIIQAARDELIRQAAQDEVLHNDDTGMRCCAWRASRLKGAKPTAPVCSPPASSPHNKGAGSRSTSPAASTPAKICAMCSNTVPQISPRLCRCVMRRRAISLN
jgi:hypothetical protein